jgi:hypothetical protein
MKKLTYPHILDTFSKYSGNLENSSFSPADISAGFLFKTFAISKILKA